jgi:hypothetical protein
MARTEKYELDMPRQSWPTDLAGVTGVDTEGETAFGGSDVDEIYCLGYGAHVLHRRFQSGKEVVTLEYVYDGGMCGASASTILVQGEGALAEAARGLLSPGATPMTWPPPAPAVGAGAETAAAIRNGAAQLRAMARSGDVQMITVKRTIFGLRVRYLSADGHKRTLPSRADVLMRGIWPQKEYLREDPRVLLGSYSLTMLV